MRVLFILALLAIGACGGANPSTSENLDLVPFVAEYTPIREGYIRVGQGPGPTRLDWVGDVAKVEFLLFGHEAQLLTRPNSQSKDTARLYYVFKLPETFTGSYPCSGDHLSEVRVTGVNGVVHGKTFEICIGTPASVVAG